MSSESEEEEELEGRESMRESSGLEDIRPAVKKLPLWLTLAVPAFACGFAGSKEPWALGAMALLVAINLVLVRPEMRPPRTVVWPLALAALLMLGAFLPLPAEAWPDWRQHFAQDYGVILVARNSPQPWVSFEAWTLAMVGFCWLWSCMSRDFGTGERRWLMRMLVVLAAALAIVAIIVRYKDIVVPFWRSEWLSGYFGPFPDRNNFSGFLAMSAVLAFATAYDAWRRRSIFWLVVVLCVVSIIWALVSNTSRAGVLLFFGGVVTWMCFASFSRRSAKRIGLSTAIVLVFAAVFIIFGKPILDRMHSSGGIAQTISGDNRIQIARDAIELISQSPWLGVGLGNFNAVNALNATFADPYVRIVHPENDWLWLAAECGVPVLALFALALVAWLWHANFWGRGRDSRSGQRDRRLRSACAIGVLMIVIHGMVDVPGHSAGVPFTMILVGALALRSRLLVPTAPTLSTTFWRFGAAIFCLFAALNWFSVSMGNSLMPSRSEARRQARKAVDLAAKGDLAASKAAFDRAIQIQPLQWNYYYQRAVVELPLGLPPQVVLQDFSRMRFLEPRSALVCMNEVEQWLRYYPAYAVPALREAMKRFKERSQEFYNTVLASLYEHPDLRRQLADLATDPKYKLTYLSYAADGQDFNRCLDSLLEQDPKLDTLTPDERLALFQLWYQRGDRARLLRMLGQEIAWRKSGWPVLSEDLAAKGDYKGAWQLASENVEPPLGRPFERNGDIPQLSRAFLMHPTDASYGLELYDTQKAKGLFDDALMTLGKLAQLPDPPKRLLYEESQILAKKGDFAKAWEKMSQYLKLARQS